MLARRLGMTLAELDARMGYDEYLRWRAFHQWEAREREMAAERARQRAQEASQAAKGRRR